MEISSAVVVNKANGKDLQVAKLVKKQLENTLHILNKNGVQVLLISARENKGMGKFWNIVKNILKIQEMHLNSAQNENAEDRLKIGCGTVLWTV